jgi:glycosyltransferase involved in cell wall biosynthesis
MKILLESYNNVTQNPAGGVQTKILSLLDKLKERNIDAILFNKWENNLNDFDVLHIFKVNIENFNLMMLAKKKNIGVAVSAIIPLENSFKIKLYRYLHKLTPINTNYKLIELMLLNSDVVIAETIREANFIIDNYKIDKSKVEIIPNGVNLNLKDGSPTLIKEMLNLKRDYVLQVGRIDKNKNQLSTIRALSGTEIPVVFIGGPDPSDLAYFEQCKKEATENMFFLDWVDNKNPLLAAAYCGAKVVVLPSYKEIFGNALIEAGLTGANLVSTNELPIKEWGLSGICQTIDPFDINDLRNKILVSYQNPKTEKISKIIENKFSWKHVTEQHIKLYERISKNSYENNIEKS